MVESSQAKAVGDTQVPDEVEIARESLALLNPSDAEYISKLDALATELISRFALSRNLDDLDEAIARTEQILDLAPPDLTSHLDALCKLGQFLFRRFKVRGDNSDLEQAIGHFEAAMELSTPQQSFYLPLVGSLSTCRLNHYRIHGDVADLDRIVETSSLVLSTCPAESSDRDMLFNPWASALKERFSKMGNKRDLDTALMHYQSCLDLRPPGHPSRYIALGNLGDAMLIRFEVDGDLQDLESATDHFKSALQLCPPEQEGFLTLLMSLGLATMRLFNVQGDVEKLEMAISYYRTAMVHSTVPNMEYSRLLDNYGAALQTRYTLLGNVSDLDQAIQFLTTSSDITPPTYSGRPTTIFSLGAALHDRFNATSNVADLDSSIEKLTSALRSCGPGYHERPGMLSFYGRALFSRFKAKGDMQDLNLAASTCMDALAQSSPKELHYFSTVANLSLTLYDCFFFQSGNMEGIQAIIDHCDRALVSAPPALPALTLRIVRAKAFFQKALQGREETAVGISIDVFREIITTLPEGHAEYVTIHLQLGLSLHTRFQLRTDTRDLDESISFYRIVHRNCKRGNTNYVLVCMHLGNALRNCFEYQHDSDDTLDEAIVLLAEAEDILSATPQHSDYRASLVNLGIALFMRWQAQKMSRGDLDAAIEHLSRAMTLPASSEGYLVVYSLATCFSARYSEYESLDDLERCVQLFGKSAEQMPPRHLTRADLCRNYGHALYKLSGHRDSLHYLDAAMVFYKEALELLPASHYDQPLTYIRFAEALRSRALLLDDVNGSFEAFKLIQTFMQTLPKDSPTFHTFCSAAAELSMSMYTLLEPQDPSFMEDGFRYYEQASGYTHFHGFRSVIVALEWAEHAEKRDHSSALLAYQTCLDSLNQHLLSTASLKNRRAILLDEHWAKQSSTLATDATACAIARGQLELAVELSEQGRGLLWSQMAQSRTPLDTLRSVGDAGRALALDFERVSAKLSQSAVTRPENSIMASRLTTEEAARRYRQLSKELEDVVVRIRQQDGFQSFLDRPLFQSLQRAALGGPVILVNVSRRRCDALIVLHDAPPRLVPLSDTTLDDLTTLSAELYQMLKMTSRVGEEKIRERQLLVMLRTLWDTVVCPIVDELTKFSPRGARIWWCPTSKLTSLPLHAAGPYRKGALNLANMYVSSYTPTLAALIRARHRPSTSKATATPPGFVAIGQAKPSSSTSRELQTVDAELALIQSLLPPSMPFSGLSGEASTADAALTALRTQAWAHLACHGRPNVEQPFDSSFALNDRAVTVLDIVGGRTTTEANVNLPEFAFLSACYTTVGDRHAPDEIIHLAAAMQFAGFRSVIGTMWAVDDGMANEMVKSFYTHLFSPSLAGKSGDGRVEWDCTQAARALNRATKSVNKDIVTIDQRIVFIHIGA